MAAARNPLNLPLIALLVLFITGCNDRPAALGGDTVKLELAGRTFTLELALDPATRYRGLSDRESIAHDGGMLFVFPDHDVSPKTFVMRRCLVPIDIMFLDRDGRIVAMHAMLVEPYDTPDEALVRYSSRYAAQFAIELAGGTLMEMNLKVGDLVNIPRKDLKGRAS